MMLMNAHVRGGSSHVPKLLLLLSQMLGKGGALANFFGGLLGFLDYIHGI